MSDRDQTTDFQRGAAAMRDSVEAMLRVHSKDMKRTAEAARIAQKASAFAADALMLRENLNEPMPTGPLKRFTEELQDLIEACNGR